MIARWISWPSLAGVVVALFLGAHRASAQDVAAPTPIDIAHAPAPLFDDPVWHGATDPFVIWNPLQREWWMFYTQRRSSMPNPTGVDWVHGSAIGIATSKDGTAWKYAGIAQGDHDLSDPIKGNVTWWAPCFLAPTKPGAPFHMWVVQVDGIYTKWTGQRHILHFTSPDLLHWSYESTAALSSDRVIDPTVYRINDNPASLWYMVYKDEAHGSHTYLAHSPDLSKWTVDGMIVGGSGHEAPFVWHWKNAWWLIVDGYGKGLRIYRSDDGIKDWTLNNTVLSKKDGTRSKDDTAGYHPAIVMQGDQCLLFYFTEYPNHYSYIQLAELELGADGKVTCDRNQYASTTPPPYTLPATQPAATQPK